MPWSERSIMDHRAEFVMLARAEGASLSLLCRRFGISRPTGYKWLARAQQESGLADRSRRPHSSPQRSSSEVESAVLSVRREHPVWGGRKIARALRDCGLPSPAPSTVTTILRRHGLIDPVEAAKHRPFQRFERAEPNELWQMDFKGDFALEKGRCFPLTVLDDHSRYDLCLAACANQRRGTVQEHLIETFRRYGLPLRMLMDNGPPWGTLSGAPLFRRHTLLTVWLMLLGIKVSHGRPYHPQTQGKDERFHRTLKAEVLQQQQFRDLPACQKAFDAWRRVYNLKRPHEALRLEVPASRYQPSKRSFPDRMPAVEYGPGDQVRRVQHGGKISFAGREFRLPKAFRGQPVAFRPTTTDGIWLVFFTVNPIAQVDLRDRLTKVQTVNHVPEQV
jgi:transposase InsO family protein